MYNTSRSETGEVSIKHDQVYFRSHHTYQNMASAACKQDFQDGVIYEMMTLTRFVEYKKEADGTSGNNKKTSIANLHPS